MKIIVTKDNGELCETGAQILKEAIAENPSAVLGLAAGKPAMGVYERLAQCYARGEVSFKNVRVFGFDERVGANSQTEGSHARALREVLLDRVDIDPARTHFPDGTAAERDAERERYARLVRENPPDVHVLCLPDDTEPVVAPAVQDVAQAKCVLLLASGQSAASAVFALANGALHDSEFAALWQTHENAVWLLDKEAARLL